MERQTQPEIKETIKIISYSDGTTALWVNGKQMSAYKVGFDAQVGEIPVLRIEMNVHDRMIKDSKD